MTAYMPRAPLQLIQNPHMMPESSWGHGNGRRTSARLADKDDVFTNGVSHENEPVKKVTSGKQGKKNAGVGTKAGGKRKNAYDEEDDGFAFTRTRAKKAKAEPNLPPTAEENKHEEQADPAPPKRSRKESISSPTEKEGRTGKRRSARHSAEHESTGLSTLLVKKRRKDHAASETKSDQPVERYPKNPQRTDRHSPQNQSHSYETTFDATKIALPFADTPVIRRNKEMRKTNGARRSSLGLRGRRASSLIDTGKSNALPHDEVESSEFYKHIESEGLSEPRRMKQLLTWCGTRALGEKPSFPAEDSGARLAAREIQSQLLKDFSTNSALSDWFGRNDSEPAPSAPRPNPKNLSNQAKIKDLEQQIARLKVERESWESLARPPSSNTPLLTPLPPAPPSPSDAIDATILASDSQTSALHSLASTSHPSLLATTSSRIARINQTLEFEVDTFANNVHVLGAYKDAAERVADEVLGRSADLLERKDGEGRARAVGGEGEVGVRDVLRILSRIVER